MMKAAFGAMALLCIASWAHADEAVERGRNLFRRLCSPCHDAEKDGKIKLGANLYNLFGTIGGTQPDFRYSPAMREKHIIWTAENIDAHTKAPMEFTPGTYMAFVGIKNDNDRRDLIAYLREVTALDETEGAKEFDTTKTVTFYPMVRNILLHRCGECHGHLSPLPAQRVKGMLLETHEEVTKRTNSGIFVQPGNPMESKIFRFLMGHRT